MVEEGTFNPETRVRFPVPAPNLHAGVDSPGSGSIPPTKASPRPLREITVQLCATLWRCPLTAGERVLNPETGVRLSVPLPKLCRPPEPSIVLARKIEAEDA